VAPPPEAGVHDEFGLDAPVGNDVVPRISGQVGPVADDEVTTARRAAVLEPELGLLRQRADAVRGDGRGQQPQDLGELAWLEGTAQLFGPQTSSASTAASEAVARAAAAVASATCWSSL
jgi:hypothetical protein